MIAMTIISVANTNYVEFSAERIGNVEHGIKSREFVASTALRPSAILVRKYFGIYGSI